LKPIGKSRAGALLALALLTLTAGCGGINASKSVSPLDFILPGLMKATPAPAPKLVPLPQPLPDAGHDLILVAQAS